ncbi:MAG: hypothetical protein QUV35_12240 [Hydrogenophaga sp.]|uniref:hypothetical protein n=1 Tax=Hydrogenophaga sp. TaxID=1904254 RepID=UPI00261D799A|nr:hypothetical protein [Hydrogenophaga sp.]MDM7943389.1 hypothetical protein [Hydrogenophaga sp.]
MKTRVNNATEAPTDPTAAKAMLRSSYLQTEGYAPALNLLDVLIAAYPEAQRPAEDGEPGGTDWQLLAWQLAMDFVPAFQEGGAPGRPASGKDGLVEAVEGLIASGKASSITQACNILERRAAFPEIEDVRQAYYRERRKKNP